MENRERKTTALQNEALLRGKRNQVDIHINSGKQYRRVRERKTLKMDAICFVSFATFNVLLKLFPNARDVMCWVLHGHTITFTNPLQCSKYTLSC